jgi:UDP-hydrolysing UDP-N-acetyl-D-glucosamine 2-epimerase
MRKVCVVITARPSYSRIKTALEAIRARDDLELQLVVAASALLDRYGDAVRCIEEDGFAIAARVYMVVEGATLASMAKTTGLGMMELASVFDSLKPDLVVTIADRYETLATAVAASYMNLPVGHVQGGEVTGSIDEKVRHAVTKLSNLHFVATDRAARRVIAMGEDPSCVFRTGCPSIDLAADVAVDPTLTFDPFQKYGGVGGAPDIADGYVVVMQHPVTTECDLARTHILETLYAVREVGLPALVFWPNVDAGSDGTSNGIRTFRETYSPDDVHFFKNMRPTDFLRLLCNCRCLVGNSSVGVREGSYLGVPVVNVGSRQDGRERGRNVLDVGYDRDEIATAMRRQVGVARFERDTTYGDGRAGERIAEIAATAPLKVEKWLQY